MSGRIYDSGINPICDICGNDMYTSAERNFNGCKCKNVGCDGSTVNAIYQAFKTVDNDCYFEYINGKRILHGVFTEFSNRSKPILKVK